MQESNDKTPSIRRRPLRAAVAALLAAALTFMAFDAGTLRAAFADESVQQVESGHVDQVGDVGDDGDDGADGDASLPPEGAEGTAEDGESPSADQEQQESADVEGASARDGPRSDEGAGLDDPTGEPEAGDEGGQPLPQAEEGDPAAPLAGETVSCFVRFYSNAPSQNPRILACKLVTAEEGQVAVVDVSGISAPAPTGAQAFDGWLYAGATHRDQVSVDPRDGDVSLYPSFLTGHWLRFVSGEAGSGAAFVPSQFVEAGADVPDTLPTTTRVGYAFEGWFTGSTDGDAIAYGDQVTDGSGNVLDPAALRDGLGNGDVELFAKWRGVQTEYRVMTWFENPDDEFYTYQGYDTVGDDPGERAISGEMTDVSGFAGYPGFELVEANQKVIAGDGSTAVHLRYDRIRYSVVFHQERSEDSDIFGDLTITDKYGADIHDRWPEPSAKRGYMSAWYTLADEESKVFVSGIGTMPLGGAHYYLKTDSGVDCNLVFRIQDVDGSENFTDYVAQPFSSEGTLWTTADDYKPIPGFMVNAASPEDAQAIIDIPAGDKAATHNGDFSTSAPVGARFNTAPEVTEEGDVPRHTLYFYYLRCQYDIVFEENGGPEVDDVKGVYYEASLAGKEPTSYVAGETTYVAGDGAMYTFQGWCADETLAGPVFDFSTAEMPPGNVVLYAKWEPTKHRVQVDPAGGEFVNPAQSTYFYVEHGEVVGDIEAERHYVADPAGQYVYNYETESADTDKFGEAEYVIASAGDTGDRYRYAPGTYTLYGWYHADSTSSADAPFDFGEPITEDTSIVARWRSAGTFDIAYDPSVEVDGVVVNGIIDTPRDTGYADLSPTHVMNTPEDITSETGDAYEFVGWRVVESFEEGAEVLVPELYREGDVFVVDSALASDNTIHLQALYDPAGGAGASQAEPTGPAGQAEGGFGATVANASAGIAGAAAGDSDVGLLPKLGDMAQVLAFAIGGIALASLAVALFGRMLRRSVASIHIDRQEP